jgi:hypothetical protein
VNDPRSVIDVTIPRPAEHAEQRQAPSAVERWAAGRIDALSREQAKIDWSKTPGAAVIRYCRAHQEWFAFVALLAYLLSYL